MESAGMPDVGVSVSVEVMVKYVPTVAPVETSLTIREWTPPTAVGIVAMTEYAPAPLA